MGFNFNTSSVSKETKQTVTDYRTRWDKQVETTREMAAVLERHLRAGGAAAPTQNTGNKAKFAQQRQQAPVGQVLTGRVDGEALEADLERIADKYEQEDKALRPDMGVALAANFGMKLTQDGNVLVGDQAIDTSSLMGVANAVVMNAKARGEDPEAAVNYLRDEMLKKAEENPPMVLDWGEEDDNSEEGGTSSNQVVSRSLYLRCPSWNSPTVQGHGCQHWARSISYVFDKKVNNFSDTDLVTAVEEAMQDWTNKTDGKVKFHRAVRGKRRYGPPWRNVGVVNIGRTNEMYSYAQVGYGVGLREFRISNILFKRKPNGELEDPDQLKRHTRHELGHVIGLIHEHQRWDRDTYIEIPSEYLQDDPGNYVRLDWSSSIVEDKLVWEFRTFPTVELVCWGAWYNFTCILRQGEGKVEVPVWKYVERTERTVYGSAGFDCYSIMLYGDLPVKPGALFPSDCTYIDEIGQKRTKNNIEISKQDAETAASLAGQ